MTRLLQTSPGPDRAAARRTLRRLHCAACPPASVRWRTCVSARPTGTAAAPASAARRTARAGGPISWTRPGCMKTTRSLTLRAKLISCVTISSVMPSSARPSTTRSTSPTSSGSSAEVISSHSITLGSIASARAIATRCCWPPESWSGQASNFSARPTRASSVRARCLGLVGRPLLHQRRRQHHVAADGQVREQVEALEDHADVLAQRAHRLRVAVLQRLAVDRRARRPGTPPAR